LKASKKVLIVTYYWPPSGGSGVQRWLKFVKYLRSYGIEPIIYTVENPNYAIHDPFLKDEIPENTTVLRRPLWEPNKLFSMFKNTKNMAAGTGFLDANPSLFSKILRYIRANFFIPDARKFWIKPSVKFLSNYLQSENIDLIITTGPPHSVNVIGLKLKERTDTPWISDFRDPWTEIDYFEQLPLTQKSIRRHQDLERDVIEKSDAVIVIGETMKKNFGKYAANIVVIPNGYDEVPGSKDHTSPLDEKFSIAHIGLMNADRNPKVFWQALSEICAENESFKTDYEIQLIGKIAPEVEKSLEDFGITNVSRTEYIPHQEVRMLQQKVQVLLLCVNKVPSAKGIITGKIFEYLQAKRPIFAIGPTNGDLAVILAETNAGSIIDFDDLATMKNKLLDLYSTYKKGTLSVSSANLEKYHRKELTGDLARLIKDTLKQTTEVP